MDCLPPQANLMPANAAAVAQSVRGVRYAGLRAPDLPQLRDGGQGVPAGRKGTGEVKASGILGMLTCDLTKPERDHAAHTLDQATAVVDPLGLAPQLAGAPLSLSGSLVSSFAMSWSRCRSAALMRSSRPMPHLPRCLMLSLSQHRQQCGLPSME
jgi:hypothetical protein